MFLLWTFLPRRCALQILRVCLLNYSSKLTRNPIWQLLIFCCSDENVPAIDSLFSLQHVFHLGVNQKSKSHPDAPFRRSSNDEMEPTRAGEEALLAERSFTSPPTILPHNVMKRIRQTRARVLHKHRRNDPLCTQRHFVQACTHAYSITNQLVPYITWTQTCSSHRLYANTVIQHPSIIRKQTSHTHTSHTDTWSRTCIFKFLSRDSRSSAQPYASAPERNSRCLNWRQTPGNKKKKKNIISKN